MLQLTIANFRKGSYLLVEGRADSNRFFIIQSGHVACYKENDPSAQTMLGPGDFVGVICCMSNHVENENAVAATDVVAIAVRKDQYPELIEKNTPVAMKIIRTFATRMREVNDSLTRLTLKSATVQSPEQLFTNAKYYEANAKIMLALYAYYQYLKVVPTGENAEYAKKRIAVFSKNGMPPYLEPTAEAIRNYTKDSMVFSECQSGNDMFIIQSGQIKITKVVEGNEVTLAILKKGDFFGEMALLENKPRSANAICFDDCILMVVNRTNFNQMVTTQPQMIARLTNTLAERLWSMSRQLENAKIQEPEHKMIDMLALQLDKQHFACVRGSSFKFEFNQYELLNMCGIPLEQQAIAINQFLKDPLVRIQENKIFAPDCEELSKTAAFYRKQRAY